jgi:hypothetical protein
VDELVQAPNEAGVKLILVIVAGGSNLDGADGVYNVVVVEQHHDRSGCGQKVAFCLRFAGRLYSIAQALGVEVSYFYEGLQTAGGSTLSPSQRMVLDLARNFLSIPDPSHREAIGTLARALAEEENGDDRAA